jgi:hypothetical protein
MLNYGGSITSAFPNTFCSSPAQLTCQLCQACVNEILGSTGLYKLEKCTHCGINICDKCFNENQECSSKEDGFHMRHSPLGGAAANGGSSVPGTSSNSLNQSTNHYNTVKKEFKQMYNYSKEIVEKLHLLNNAIKIEEATVSELNLIKHQVNTKAIELIKQINQEKCELIEQIENVKRKYES